MSGNTFLHNNLNIDSATDYRAYSRYFTRSMEYPLHLPENYAHPNRPYPSFKNPPIIGNTSYMSNMINERMENIENMGSNFTTNYILERVQPYKEFDLNEKVAAAGYSVQDTNVHSNYSSGNTMSMPTPPPQSYHYPKYPNRTPKLPSTNQQQDGQEDDKFIKTINKVVANPVTAGLIGYGALKAKTVDRLFDVNQYKDKASFAKMYQNVKDPNMKRFAIAGVSDFFDIMAHGAEKTKNWQSGVGKAIHKGFDKVVNIGSKVHGGTIGVGYKGTQFLGKVDNFFKSRPGLDKAKNILNRAAGYAGWLPLAAPLAIAGYSYLKNRKKENGNAPTNNYR